MSEHGDFKKLREAMPDVLRRNPSTAQIARFRTEAHPRRIKQLLEALDAAASAKASDALRIRELEQDLARCGALDTRLADVEGRLRGALQCLVGNGPVRHEVALVELFPVDLGDLGDLEDLEEDLG